MTDEAAIRRACCYAPEDDAPRLVLCDWLEERGQQAEAFIIRRMIYMPSYTFHWRRGAAHGRHSHAEERKDIIGLKGAIEAVYRKEWDTLPGVEGITIRRGMVEAVTIPSSAFLTGAGAVFTRHPVVSVRLPDLRVYLSFNPPHQVDVLLAQSFETINCWPPELFSEYQAYERVTFATRDEALGELSRRAAAYGRVMAGIPGRPPPLPAKAEAWPVEAIQTHADATQTASVEPVLSPSV
jgi:uncharacterized protein (TIGR02996 family)